MQEILVKKALFGKCYPDNFLFFIDWVRHLIITKRFILSHLTVNDVTERYLGWLNDSVTAKYISSRLNIFELRKYVLERCGRDDILFLGIHDKCTGLHIGNIKYEPVNSILGYAIMGILIGDSQWRGKGVAAEVLLATARWLNHNRHIKEIILSVDKKNISAIRAYSKVGFREKSTTYIKNTNCESTSMIWKLPNFSIFC